MTQSSSFTRRPINRQFDPSTLSRYVQVPKLWSFSSQSTIANARALAMCPPASHSDSVVEESYRRSLFFITSCNFMNKINIIMDPTMKSKTNAGIGFTNVRISDRRCSMESIKVN
jgi:hypothetical protein